jgi:phosphoribosylcarboxyaminoimidazole (NCAIR) mutase
VSVVSKLSLPVPGTQRIWPELWQLTPAFRSLGFPLILPVPGVPVATMAIGKSGARNAGILAVQILALADPVLAERLDKYKQNMAAKVEQKAKKLESSI